MEITYLGKTSFKLKSKTGVVVTTPFTEWEGKKWSSVSCDVLITNGAIELSGITGTSRREKPFVINEPGEYEVDGISVFGMGQIYLIQSEGMRLLYLGGVTTNLSEELLNELGTVDLIMVPIGEGALEPKEMIKIIEKIEPTYVLPMGMRKQDTEEFVKAYEHGSRQVTSLSLSVATMPTDITEVILFD